MAILARKKGFNISPIFGPPDARARSERRSERGASKEQTREQQEQQQQQQQQEQEQERQQQQQQQPQQQQQQQQQEQEQEQSQVTESKRHRTKTMKNQYLSRGSGGPGQGCSDSSKNTQPQFLFSGDLGPEGGFQHKPDFWPTGIDSTTTQKTTSTCKTFPHQQQQQQQQQQRQQEQEQSQVTESKRHRTKTMKNQYLSRGLGGPGQ